MNKSAIINRIIIALNQQNKITHKEIGRQNNQLKELFIYAFKTMLQKFTRQIIQQLIKEQKINTQNQIINQLYQWFVPRSSNYMDDLTKLVIEQINDENSYIKDKLLNDKPISLYTLYINSISDYIRNNRNEIIDIIKSKLPEGINITVEEKTTSKKREQPEIYSEEWNNKLLQIFDQIYIANFVKEYIKNNDDDDSILESINNRYIIQFIKSLGNPKNTDRLANNFQYEVRRKMYSSGFGGDWDWNTKVVQLFNSYIKDNTTAILNKIFLALPDLAKNAFNNMNISKNTIKNIAIENLNKNLELHALQIAEIILQEAKEKQKNHNEYTRADAINTIIDVLHIDNNTEQNVLENKDTVINIFFKPYIPNKQVLMRTPLIADICDQYVTILNKYINTHFNEIFKIIQQQIALKQRYMAQSMNKLLTFVDPVEIPKEEKIKQVKEEEKNNEEDNLKTKKLCIPYMYINNDIIAGAPLFNDNYENWTEQDIEDILKNLLKRWALKTNHKYQVYSHYKDRIALGLLLTEKQSFIILSLGNPGVDQLLKNQMSAKYQVKTVTDLNFSLELYLDSLDDIDDKHDERLRLAKLYVIDIPEEISKINDEITAQWKTAKKQFNDVIQGIMNNTDPVDPKIMSFLKRIKYSIQNYNNLYQQQSPDIQTIPEFYSILTSYYDNVKPSLEAIKEKDAEQKQVRADLQYLCNDDIGYTNAYIRHIEKMSK